jgi:hypothetical protein
MNHDLELLKLLIILVTTVVWFVLIIGYVKERS